ncbi:MAG: carboxypeptidase regulatory-like domain-containing protein, partial [Bryobacteraceae bacterium]
MTSILRYLAATATHIFLGLTLATAFALGQLSTGTISGRVLDPDGAGVPGAKLQLTEQQTGVTRTATSDDSGFYLFPLIPVGLYQISVEVPGFKTSEQRDLRLEVNQNLTIPVRLELGTVTETVQVTGAPPQVDTVSSSVKEVVDRTRISELPLNGRNVLQLQQLVNGAVFTGSGDQFGNTPAFQVNGGVSFSNNYTLDGGEHTDSFFNSAITFPNPDAIEEFSIQTSSYSAEFGRNRGATVNAVTRSGSNSFHGSLFEFVRNDVFDARDFFAPKKPPFKRNQFGATVGGPIKRNTAFFFFAWESTRERGAPNTATFQVPSAAMRRGDFSELPRTIRDPLTGDPFPGNQIPAGRLNQPAIAFLEEYTPLPNLPGLLFSGPRSTTFNRDQYIGRYDHQFSANDRIFVRYMWNKDTSLVNRGSFTDWYQDQAFRRQTLTGNHTRTFSPVHLNTFTFTFNRVTHLVDIIPHFDWKTLGADFPDTVPDQKGWAQVTLPGYFAASNGVPWDVRRNTYNIADTFTWIKNRHSLKFGAQISRYNTAQLFEFLSAGAIVFSGQFSGDPAADMVLGRMASMRQDSPGKNDLRQTLWGFFVSDDIRVHPRFTLNLGLRYEPYLGFRELNGQAAAFRPGQQSRLWPTAPTGLLLQGDEGVHENFFAKDWNNFAPRVGFAWDLFGNQKLALRGGYGIFYDSVAGIRLNRFVTSQPFLLDIEVQDRPLADPYLGNSPFPYFPPQTAEERQNFRFVLPANQISANENMVTPYTQQWNLTIEHQLPANLVVSTGYV